MTLSKEKLDASVAAISSVLIGKEAQVRVALACLLARGHLLIEDLPGMGKTTLANAMARVLGLDYNRIQFTSDLLPADIVGVSVYERAESAFRFHPGPVFCQLLLADEINRTTPKTQSALLEAMAEGQVTVEGETRGLPQPFFRDRHAEPGPVFRYVSAARVAAGSLPDAAVTGLSGPFLGESDPHRG